MVDQQEEGWPLGLQPLSLRLGQIRSYNFSGSFSTVNSDSSRSTSLTTSDFDSESTESLFREKTVTLRSILEASSISCQRSGMRKDNRTAENRRKSKAWFSSLCRKTELEREDEDDSTTSLGQFLQMERKACHLHGFCQANNNQGIQLIFHCIRFGGQLRRSES